MPLSSRLAEAFLFSEGIVSSTDNIGHHAAPPSTRPPQSPYPPHFPLTHKPASSSPTASPTSFIRFPFKMKSKTQQQGDQEAAQEAGLKEDKETLPPPAPPESKLRKIRMKMMMAAHRANTGMRSGLKKARDIAKAQMRNAALWISKQAAKMALAGKNAAARLKNNVKAWHEARKQKAAASAAEQTAITDMVIATAQKQWTQVGTTRMGSFI